MLLFVKLNYSQNTIDSLISFCNLCLWVSLEFFHTLSNKQCNLNNLYKRDKFVSSLHNKSACSKCFFKNYSNTILDTQNLFSNISSLNFMKIDEHVEKIIYFTDLLSDQILTLSDGFCHLHRLSYQVRDMLVFGIKMMHPSNCFHWSLWMNMSSLTYCMAHECWIIMNL